MKGRCAGIIVGLAMMTSPATANPLKPGEVLKQIGGWWGYSENSKNYPTCARQPMHIWIEDNGYTFKSQFKGYKNVYTSKITRLPPAAGSNLPERIAVTFPDWRPPRKPNRYSVIMPTPDRIEIKAVEGGPSIPALVRCGKPGVS